MCNIGFLCWIVVLIGTASGHVYRLGSRCPSAPVMRNFDMDKFLGVWYAIEKSRSFVDCMVYNITQPDPVHHPGEYRVQQTSVALGSGRIRYAGLLWTPGGRGGSNKGSSSRMRVQYSLNPIGASSFDVFDTDYTTYAGIYTCQPLMIFHRQSATILSRSKHLDERISRQLLDRLYGHNIHSLGMRKIHQNDCDRFISADISDAIFQPAETFTEHHTGKNNGTMVDGPIENVILSDKDQITDDDSDILQVSPVESTTTTISGRTATLHVETTTERLATNETENESDDMDNEVSSPWIWI